MMFGNLVKNRNQYIPSIRCCDPTVSWMQRPSSGTIGRCNHDGGSLPTNTRTIGIVIGGFLAFACHRWRYLLRKTVQPVHQEENQSAYQLQPDLSAVPMRKLRVANELHCNTIPKTNVLQYCMASNISGVISSAVAAGVLKSFWDKKLQLFIKVHAICSMQVAREFLFNTFWENKAVNSEFATIILTFF